MGGKNSLSVTAREVLRPALIAGAPAIIMGHNHPSGDVSPSSADLEMTRSVVAAADVIGIPVLDHVIVTDEGADASLLELYPHLFSA